MQPGGQHGMMQPGGQHGVGAWPEVGNLTSRERRRKKKGRRRVSFCSGAHPGPARHLGAPLGVTLGVLGDPVWLFSSAPSPTVSQGAGAMGYENDPKPCWEWDWLSFLGSVRYRYLCT